MSGCFFSETRCRITKLDVTNVSQCVLETPLFWGVKIENCQGHELQKQCRRGSLHYCECWLLIVCRSIACFVLLLCSDLQSIDLRVTAVALRVRVLIMNISRIFSVKMKCGLIAIHGTQCHWNKRRSVRVTRLEASHQRRREFRFAGWLTSVRLGILLDEVWRLTVVKLLALDAEFTILCTHNIRLFLQAWGPIFNRS